MPAGWSFRLAGQNPKQIVLTRQTGESDCASVFIGEQWGPEATRRSSFRVKTKVPVAVEGLESAALDEKRLFRFAWKAAV
jgi:hypothetical protein